MPLVERMTHPYFRDVKIIKQSVSELIEILYPMPLLDCVQLEQCVRPVCFHFDLENMIILHITYVLGLSGPRTENESCLESVQVCPKVGRVWKAFWMESGG